MAPHAKDCPVAMTLLVDEGNALHSSLVCDRNFLDRRANLIIEDLECDG